MLACSNPLTLTEPVSRVNFAPSPKKQDPHFAVVFMRYFSMMDRLNSQGPTADGYLDSLERSGHAPHLNGLPLLILG